MILLFYLIYEYYYVINMVAKLYNQHYKTFFFAYSLAYKIVASVIARFNYVILQHTILLFYYNGTCIPTNYCSI